MQFGGGPGAMDTVMQEVNFAVSKEIPVLEQALEKHDMVAFKGRLETLNGWLAECETKMVANRGQLNPDKLQSVRILIEDLRRLYRSIR